MILIFCQQVKPTVDLMQIHVFNLRSVVRCHVDIFSVDAVRAFTGKPRKRVDRFTIVANNDCIRKPLPFVAAIGEMNPVAFVGDAIRKIDAFVRLTGAQRQYRGETKHRSYFCRYHNLVRTDALVQRDWLLDRANQAAVKFSKIAVVVGGKF